MAPPENVMMLMKQYLTSMSKRIDELVAKTQALEAEVSRIAESQRSGIGDLGDKVEKLTSNQEDTHTLLQNARDEWKKRAEELEENLDGFATLESINEVQNKLDKQIETLRDEKLDRSDFQEFEDSTFNPLKELFQDADSSASGSFADFARVQASASATKVEPEVEETMPPEAAASEEPPAELPPPNIPPPPLDQKRVDKKKKKWL